MDYLEYRALENGIKSAVSGVVNGESWENAFENALTGTAVDYLGANLSKEIGNLTQGTMTEAEALSRGLNPDELTRVSTTTAGEPLYSKASAQNFFLNKALHMSKGALLGLILKGDPLVTGLAAAGAETACELVDFMGFMPARNSDWFKPTIHLIADLSGLGITTAFNSDEVTRQATNTIATLTVEHNYYSHSDLMGHGRLVMQQNLEEEIETLESLAEVVTFDFLREEILQEALALRRELNALRQAPTLSPWVQSVVDGVQAPINWTTRWNQALDRGVEYVCDLADNLPQVSFYTLMSEDLRRVHARASYWVGENVPLVGPSLQREYDRFINTPRHLFSLTEMSLRVGSSLLHLPESYGGAGLYLGTMGLAARLQTGRPFLRNLIHADATQAPMPLWSTRWAGETPLMLSGPPRVSVNRQAGRGFQEAVQKELRAAENHITFEVALPDGRVVWTKPDLYSLRYGITEIKNQVEISNVSQLRAQARLAIQENKPFNLIISPRTKSISEGVMKGIKESGGKVFEFNPSTKTFTEIINNSEKFTR